MFNIGQLAIHPIDDILLNEHLGIASLFFILTYIYYFTIQESLSVNYDSFLIRL